jgi:riboflavin biosynthesis pyrimidine reductase
MLRLWPESDGKPLSDDDIIHWYSVEPVPWLRVNFAESLDGAVTLDGYSAGLSGPEDKRVFAILRMMCDALVVGAGTVRNEGYGPLRPPPARREWRLAHGLAEYPTLVVVSRTLELDPDQSAFADAPVRPIVLTPAAPDAVAGHRMESVADVVTYRNDDIADGIDLLRDRGFRHVLSEGGPNILGALTAANLVDDLCLTLSPLLAGPGAGRITAGPPAPEPRQLELRHILSGDGQLMLRYTK